MQSLLVSLTDTLSQQYELLDHEKQFECHRPCSYPPPCDLLHVLPIINNLPPKAICVLVMQSGTFSSQ